MPKKIINWGIISTARIGLEHVIPGLLKSKECKILALASQSPTRANKLAKKFGIPKVYTSYDEMFQDPEIDAVYNPLPNHLHVPVSLAAGKAGKHILCEKPIALNAKESRKLLALPKGILCMEAFMVRAHLQWLKVLDLLKQKKIGSVKAVQAFFSYYNLDSNNIRNIKDYGGGGMYDIGCYPMVIGKLIFGTNPKRVIGLQEIDSKFNVDTLFSGIMDFGKSKHLTFTVSTQLTPIQKVLISGTKGSIEVQIPFNAIADKPSLIYLNDGTALDGSNIKTLKIPACDQYQLEAEQFNRAIRKEERLKYGVQDAIANMEIIDAIFKSCKSNKWEHV